MISETPERIVEELYDWLRARARALLANEQSGTLSATELLHEVVVRFPPEQWVDLNGPSHIKGTIIVKMRQVLVDRARRRSAAKRGGDQLRVTFTSNVGPAHSDAVVNLLALEEALAKLEALEGKSDRAVNDAKVAEMKIFGGLSNREIANELQCSVRSVQDSWSHAERWLRRRLVQ